jgi:hypothetical protein
MGNTAADFVVVHDRPFRLVGGLVEFLRELGQGDLHVHVWGRVRKFQTLLRAPAIVF